MPTDITDGDTAYRPAEHEFSEIAGGWSMYHTAASPSGQEVTNLNDPVLPGEPIRFTTKDSGTRENFETGSRRDTQDGKPRYELVSHRATKREAELMARGAGKYGERNWEKGQPMSRAFASLLRHAHAYWEGENTEDHLAAIRFNAGLLIDHEERIATGELPESLYDLPYRRRN